MSEAFRHVESDRTIVFGPAALTSSTELIGESYTLLSTPRAAASAPEVLERAATMIEVPAGQVDVVAAQLRAAVTGSRLVALGGGRVIDVAKALAAADPPRGVVAIPTSLSAAEMTSVHRHAQGVAPGTPRVRPVVVINDPQLSASQPAEALAASTANALGHAITALLSHRATPFSQAVAGEAIQRLVSGWSGAGPDRPVLALGALLAGWAVDHSGLGLHHALAQTAVRTASLEHAHTNAALLPATIRAIRSRRPAELKRLDESLGIALEAVAEQLQQRARASLGVLTDDEELLRRAVETAAKRPELDQIPPAPDHAEIREIYRTSSPTSLHGLETRPARQDHDR
ncbi:MAG: maleylacetate reductase [Solirubrobacteraceae bacterium]|jgi:maleylacetate reductase|nr:maleylacetate reductase [Solirubrobacteraceae bacterium]